MTSLQPGPARHAQAVAPMRIAMLGAHRPPAHADGIDGAVEEIGRRLVAEGHHVTVYGRATRAESPRDHLGLRWVHVPAPGAGAFGEVVHAALAALHLAVTRRHDVVILFGVAAAPLIPLVGTRSTAVALHAGGLEWKRAGRGVWMRRYLRAAERLAAREADALVADSQGIADYYDDEFGVPAEHIAYGATILRNTPSDALEALGLVPGQYHLAVADLEPEHRVDVIVEAYHRSEAHLPLVVVGSAVRPDGYAAAIGAVAQRDGRIRLLGRAAGEPGSDERVLDQLHAHALDFVDGRSVGGTSRSLLRAMGAGTAIVAWDVVFNREVAGTAGSYFSGVTELTRLIEDVERYPFRFRDIGELMQERARRRYDWDSVTESYEALAAKLARAWSTRGMSSGRRTDSAWSVRREPVELGRSGT